MNKPSLCKVRWHKLRESHGSESTDATQRLFLSEGVVAMTHADDNMLLICLFLSCLILSCLLHNDRVKYLKKYSKEIKRPGRWLKRLTKTQMQVFSRKRKRVRKIHEWLRQRRSAGKMWNTSEGLLVSNTAWKVHQTLYNECRDGQMQQLKVRV